MCFKLKAILLDASYSNTFGHVCFWLVPLCSPSSMPQTMLCHSVTITIVSPVSLSPAVRRSTVPLDPAIRDQPWAIQICHQRFVTFSYSDLKWRRIVISGMFSFNICGLRKLLKVSILSAPESMTGFTHCLVFATFVMRKSAEINFEHNRF